MKMMDKVLAQYTWLLFLASNGSWQTFKFVSSLSWAVLTEKHNNQSNISLIASNRNDRAIRKNCNAIKYN
jgi:hypothetical protein